MAVQHTDIACALGDDFVDCGSDMNETTLNNQAPTKVQCAECHWTGLSSELEIAVRRGLTDSVLACPVCWTAFARYPQKAEHLWSDPY
jgi:hypothetical protein